MGKLTWVLALQCLLVAACANRDSADLFAPEAGTIVVDAFLIVGEPLPSIALTQTLAADVPYTFAQAALSGALVVVTHELGAAVYAEATPPGTYVPHDGTVPLEVEAGAQYTLDVTAADGRRVRATTRTPQRFSVPEWLLLDATGTTVQRSLASFAEYGDGVFTQPENQLEYAQGLLEARFDPTGILGIQVGLFSRSPGSPLVIDPDLVDEEDLDRINSSPPFEPGDGKVRLPWFAIFFEGRYVLKVWTMDVNWFDLARTDPVLRGGGFGFGGQAGDDFERPIFHVEGGIGLFGSGAVDSVGVVVHPRP